MTWQTVKLAEISGVYNMTTMSGRPTSGYSADELIVRLDTARSRLRALIAALPGEGWLGPLAAHLNPPLWEFGHIVWFQERWCLRARADGSYGESLLQNADALYDSSTVAHDTRWRLPLLHPTAVEDYAGRVADAIAARLRTEPDGALAYYAELCLYHELMHVEAWWMAFQALGYAAPVPIVTPSSPHARRLAFAAHESTLGSRADQGFIFDNEKWQHPVAVDAFEIDSVPVSEAVFKAFVDALGYRRDRHWSAAGLAWRNANSAEHPVYWRRHAGFWQVRSFDGWRAADPDRPMLHINRFEAEACAAWLGRQLPSAAQWQAATTLDAFHWGQAWEWLREPFAPYPGFAADPYQDYSQPWFHSHWELRGAGPVTDVQLKRPGFRNFYLPHRRDPFAGFRTVNL